VSQSALAPLALLSVSDKSGIVDFGRGLVALGYEILSTGGTARALGEGGVPVTKVSDYTGAPEVFNGRVKTLHPRIHGGILGRRDHDEAEASANDIRWIDVVAVNLYPFEATISKPGVTLSEAVEQIDIGGPCMVRAAAKNHAHVTVVCDPGDYERVVNALSKGGLDRGFREELAVKAFRHTAAYDGLIATWMAEQVQAGDPIEGALPMRKVQDLRYGENPHQRAGFYAQPGATGRSMARLVQHQGKHLSFNNLADLDAALRAVFEFVEPACVVVKHHNPCGAAIHQDGPARAWELALSGDPVSAFGSIVAFNRPLEADDVRAIRRSRVFMEILAAPGFSAEALALLEVRKNLRVMEIPADWADQRPSGQDIKRVQGGYLIQDWDLGLDSEWKTATQQAPDDDQMRALRFAWAIGRNVKSNAIVLARAIEGGVVLNGVGAGQMSRVDSVRLALSKATRPVPGSVLSSDAFFPFPDGVKIAVDAGVAAVVQPGGSKKDDVVTAAVEAGGAVMVHTGVRHFRH
jgi:phosphoribosylaminoimidazolecarboxamide formyltransferase/IMP cyclohydrolase